jgi:hypothetical protein
MNWNQEELEQWALTQQQKEEDNEALAAYRAQDDSKLKELNMAVERMSKTVHAYKAELDREVTDTQAAQVQLDKAADDFAVLHKVRSLQPTCCWDCLWFVIFSLRLLGVVLFFGFLVLGIPASASASVSHQSCLLQCTVVPGMLCFWQKIVPLHCRNVRT